MKTRISNIFTIKSLTDKSQWCLCCSNGISNIAIGRHNFKNVEVHKQDICFDSSHGTYHYNRKKEDMIKLYMEEVPMSFCFYEEQMEKLFLGSIRPQTT